MEAAERDRFIESNLPLVHKLANRFRGRGVEYEELYSAGCVGLIKACDRFEPEKPPSTYCVKRSMPFMRQ